MRFLDPKNDVAFRRIFGNEKKKGILMSFLNSVLHLNGPKTITDVTLLSPLQAPRIKGGKQTILDARCHDQAGSEYIVEMQVLPQPAFDQRVLYYTSRAYAHQLNKGMDYHKLKPVIFLGVLDFSLTQNDHYLSIHKIYDVETREHLLRDFAFHFIELPKFNKKEQDLKTIEEKWIYFLKYTPELSVVPAVIQEEAIKEAFEVVEKMKWGRRDLEIYDNSGIYIRDELLRLDAKLAEGIEKGMQQGIEKGMQQGIEKGIETTVLKMLKKNVSIEDIAEFTGLSAEKIDILKETIY